MSYLRTLQNTGKKMEELDLFPAVSEKVELRLELSNICNDHCCFCPNAKMARKRTSMSKELAFRLMREASAIGIRKVGFFMNGEPFVTENLADYIRYAKTYGFTYTYITTNGALATEEKLRDCFEAGLDSIKFSINAGSRESYRLVHGNDDYEKVMRHLKFAYDYREEHGLSYQILSSFVVTKYTVEELEEHERKIGPYVDELVFFHAESFAGQMIEEVSEVRAEIGNKMISDYKIKNSAPCNKLWNSINVTCEGYLTLCCSEAFNYLVVEDLNKMGLEEAWHSERMAGLRKRHLENALSGTQCEACLNGNKEGIEPLNRELYLQSLA